MDVTVCTLTRDRTTHLVRQIRGLLGSARRPAGHVVAVMGGEDPRPAVPSTPWRTVFLDVGADGDLPLAHARNAAVEAADTEGIVLLDVDCIPSSGLVASYGNALDAFDGLLMGGVRYLPPGWATGIPDVGPIEDAVLHRLGERHPARPEPPRGGGIDPTDRYELFWSLSFAVRRSTISGRIGGFDEQYGGYGGEDTDLALRARQAEVPLAWLGDAWAFHQHHDTYDPPVQHVASIVQNAERFHEVWGRWPMEGWLTRFADMGLVRWGPGGETLELLREPSEAEFAAAHRPTAVPRDEANRA